MTSIGEQLTDEEIMLNNFFEILDNLKQKRNLQSIKELFTQKDEKMIPLLDFRSTLLSLGFEENSEMIQKIIKKYTPIFDRSVISIENMYIEYKIYEERKEYNKQIKEKQRQIEEIKLKNTSKLVNPNNNSSQINNANMNNNYNNPPQPLPMQLQQPQSSLVIKQSDNGLITGANNIPNNQMQPPFGSSNNNSTINVNSYNNNNQMPSQVYNNPYMNQLNNNNNIQNNTFNSNSNNRLGYVNNNSTNNNQIDYNRPPTFGRNSITSDNNSSSDPLNTPQLPRNSNPMSTNQLNNNTTNPTKKKEILDKLSKMDAKLLEELKQNHNYIKTKIYENFFTYYKVNELDFENTIRRYDKTKSGFLDGNEFNSLFDEILVLSENEKSIILMDLQRNQVGKYSYIDFIEKVQNFKSEDITNQIKTFHHSYNDYIVKLRNFVKFNNIDLLESWKQFFNETPKIDLMNFKTLLNNINYPPLFEEEYEYLFEKLSDDKKKISYSKFNSIMKLNPPSRDNLLANNANNSHKKLDDSFSKNNNNNENNNNYFHNNNNNFNNNNENFIESKRNFKNNNNNNMNIMNKNNNNNNMSNRSNPPSGRFKIDNSQMNNFTNIQNDNFENENNLNSEKEYDNYNDNDDVPEINFKNKNNNNNNINNKYTSDHNNSFNYNNKNNFNNNIDSNNNFRNNTFQGRNNNNFMNDNFNNYNSNINNNKNNISNNNSNFNSMNNRFGNSNNSFNSNYNNINNNFNSNNNNPNPNPNFMNSNFSNQNFNYQTLAFRRSSVRQAQNFNEIRSLSAEDSKKVIYQRIAQVDNFIRNEMENLEQNKLFSILYMLKKFFLQIGNTHVLFFQKRDFRQDGFISELDFNMVFTEMRLDLTKEQRDLMIKSIKNRSQTHVCYVEFLQNVYSFNPIEFEKLLKYCNQNYNDYICELRNFIKENNLNSIELWDGIIGKLDVIDYKTFENFLQNFNFNLSHEEEYKYLYSIISSQDGSLDKNHFIDLMIMDPPSIEKFRESFELRGNNESKLNLWKFKISNYTESSAKLHREQYKSLSNFFNDIHDASLKKGIKDLVSHFSNINVNTDGECDETEFINLISQLGVYKNANFFMVSDYFGNPKNKKLINLVKFFNAYYSFYYKEKDISSDKTADALNPRNNSTNANNSNNNNPNFVIDKNNHPTNSQNNFMMSDNNQNFNNKGNMNMNNNNNNNNVPNLNLNTVNNKNKNNINAKNSTNSNNSSQFSLALIKPYRHLTSDEYLDVKDSINLLIDIILNEKYLNVADYFYSKDPKKNGYITLAEFHNLMRDDLQISMEGFEETLELIYSYLVDEQKSSIIRLERIITIFKELADEEYDIEMYSKINNNNNKATTPNPSKNQISNSNYNNAKANKKGPIEYMLSEFTRFLANNRVKFNSLFPNLTPKSQLITIYDFQSCFAYAKYPITPDDINMLTKHFDPYNKNTINLQSLKDTISKYEPEYFNKPFQNINQNELKRTSSLTKKINENPKMIEIISLLNAYIEENRLTLDEFANKISRNGVINKPNFTQGILNTIGKKVKDYDNLIFVVQDLYDLMDKNKNENLDINELIYYLNNANLTLEERKNKVNITKNMIDELNQLFDFFDVDKDNKISKEDFFKALKSLNHNSTQNDAEVLIKQMDADGNGLIERKEFLYVLEEKIQHQMVLAQEERDYIIKLFKEEDIDKLGYLTIPQLKHLLNEKLHCNLSDNEFTELINEADCNYDGLVDIEELVKLLDKTEENSFFTTKAPTGNNPNKENVSKTLRQINSKRRINPMQFLSIFNGLPMNFIPSFIKDEQKLLKLLPASSLRPATDETGILYKDILPDINSAVGKSPSKSPLKNNANNNPQIFNNTNSFNLNQANNPNMPNITTQNFRNTDGASRYSVFNLNQSSNVRLRQIATQINTKISFEKATGVAIPDEKMLDRQRNIVGRILKIALYDDIKNCFFGNSIQIEAQWKKEYEDRWYFDEDRKSFNNNVLIRYNEDNDKKKISVIFEFVILIKKDEFITETSCGWCSCDIKNLYKPSEMKLPIYGGTPFKQENINRTDIRARRSGWAKIGQIFSGQVKSELLVKIKPFKELSNLDKVSYLILQ